MSDEINQYRNRFVEKVSMTIGDADQSSTIRVEPSSTQFIEINSMSIDVMDRVPIAYDTLYPTAMLVELSALVRRVRATSPDSVLADIADAKIGRIVALHSGDTMLESGASRGVI